MSDRLAHIDRSFLVVIDIQPSFMKPIQGMDNALMRSKFLVECAQLLGVPTVATEQVPDKMGATHHEILDLLDDEAIAKTSFSCWGEPKFRAAVEKIGRKQAVLVGIESPICVCQTAHQMLAAGYEVIVAEDTTASRSAGAQTNAIERMRAAGVILAHTESIVYEWLGSATHPAFRDVLKVVKNYSL